MSEDSRSVFISPRQHGGQTLHFITKKIKHKSISQGFTNPTLCKHELGRIWWVVTEKRQQKKKHLAKTRHLEQNTF